MAQHWNVQINIQRVEQAESTRGPMGQKIGGERQVADVLKLAVTADTELDAYLKAHRMLTANEPVGTMPPFVADESIVTEMQMPR